MPIPPERRKLVVDLDWSSVVAGIATVVALLLLAGIIHVATKTFTAAVLAVFLVLALDPAVTWVDKHVPYGRRMAVATVLAGFSIVVGVFIALVVPPTVRQARELPRQIPRVAAQLGDLPFVGERLKDADVPAAVQKAVEELPKRLTVSSVGQAARTVTDVLLAVALTFLLTVALLLDGGRIVRLSRRLIPARHRPEADRVARVFYRVVGRYAVGSLLVATATGVVVLVSGLIIGIPLTPLAALWTALWDLVPQVGGAIGGISFIVLGFTKSATAGVVALIVFFVYLQIRNHLIGPLVTGAAVALSPLATTVVVLVGVTAAGFLGGLIAVPLAGAAKAAFLELRPPAEGPTLEERIEADGH
jgi:predicted PurR-regulated permease PerM